MTTTLRDQRAREARERGRYLETQEGDLEWCHFIQAKVDEATTVSLKPRRGTARLVQELHYKCGDLTNRERVTMGRRIINRLVAHTLAMVDEHVDYDTDDDGNPLPMPIRRESLERMAQEVMARDRDAQERAQIEAAFLARLIRRGGPLEF